MSAWSSSPGMYVVVAGSTVRERHAVRPEGDRPRDHRAARPAAGDCSPSSGRPGPSRSVAVVPGLARSSVVVLGSLALRGVASTHWHALRRRRFARGAGPHDDVQPVDGLCLRRWCSVPPRKTWTAGGSQWARRWACSGPGSARYRASSLRAWLARDRPRPGPRRPARSERSRIVARGVRFVPLRGSGMFVPALCGGAGAACCALLVEGWGRLRVACRRVGKAARCLSRGGKFVLAACGGR